MFTCLSNGLLGGAPPSDQPVVPVNVAGKEHLDDHCNPRDYRLALNQGRDKPRICGGVLIHWRFLFEPRTSRDMTCLDLSQGVVIS